MRTPVHDMCIDLCRADVFVPEQLLNRSYVIPRFKQMRRETVSERMA